jgi:hypothetical protein
VPEPGDRKREAPAPFTTDGRKIINKNAGINNTNDSIFIFLLREIFSISFFSNFLSFFK